MSHQSQAARLSQSTGSARPQALLFDRDEWELIVTLPRRVLIAASAAAPPGARQGAQGIAGIEAIASGLASSSPLVREVVASIYSESHSEPVALLGEQSDTVQTLAACRYASEVLAARCSSTDAQAYREWLGHIAAVVTGVAQGLSVTPIAADQGTQPAGAQAPGTRARVGMADNRFLYALGGVLRA